MSVRNTVVTHHVYQLIYSQVDFCGASKAEVTQKDHCVRCLSVYLSHFAFAGATCSLWNTGSLIMISQHSDNYGVNDT